MTAEASKPRKFLDQVRDALRIKHYVYRTEESYSGFAATSCFITNVIPKTWLHPK